MSSVTAPTMAFRQIDWNLDQPAQVNDSSFNANREAAASQWFGKWSAKVTLKTVEDEASFCPIRSFLIRCQGPNNSFRLPAVVEPQNSNSGVTVSGTAAKGALSLSLSGASAPLVNGQLVTVNGQLLQLTRDQNGSSIAFQPPLHTQATSGTSVETANPYTTVFIPTGNVSWDVSPPQRFDAAFNVEEAYT